LRGFFLYYLSLGLGIVIPKVYLYFMERKCKNCGRTFNIEEFANAGTLKGVKYYRHVCKACYYESKKPRKEMLKKWLVDYKKTQKCEWCGNNDHRVLEFHHANNDKEFTVSDGLTRAYGPERMLKEIKKCTPLCANCHRAHHYDEVHNNI
jgi:hypothetical protein